jgi:hypothetical protein
VCAKELHGDGNEHRSHGVEGKEQGPEAHDGLDQTGGARRDLYQTKVSSDGGQGTTGEGARRAHPLGSATAIRGTRARELRGTGAGAGTRRGIAAAGRARAASRVGS